MVKPGRLALAMLLAATILLGFGQTAHAQSLEARYDRASYVPGDSGTLIVTVLNNQIDAIALRNITVYYPWAQLVDGKWPSGANGTLNFSPVKTLGNQASGNNIYSNSFSFTIPTWYGGNPFGLAGGNCPGSTSTRYGLYNGCILVGTNATSRYDGHSFGITMAQAAYTPMSLVTEWLPIATLAVLVVATIFLGMAWMSLRRAAKKA